LLLIRKVILKYMIIKDVFEILLTDYQQLTMALYIVIFLEFNMNL
jgi:hypothetical protein